jgi:hypothetical protein
MRHFNASAEILKIGLTDLRLTDKLRPLSRRKT